MNGDEEGEMLVGKGYVGEGRKGGEMVNVFM